MKVIAAVQDFIQADIFLHDIDIVDGHLIGELTRRSVSNHSKNVRLLVYNCHICYVSNINALFKAHGFPSCDHFIKKAQHLEQHLTSCKERIKHVFLKDVHQLRERNLTN